MSVPLSFINAKLRGRRRRVYEGERLEGLKQKRSVRALWEEFYPRQPATGRVALERQLREERVQELCSFAHLLPPDVGGFYRTLLRRFQLDNILVLLRLFAGGQEGADPAGFMPELPAELAVPSGELLGSSDLEGFVAKLPPRLARAGRATTGLYDEHSTTAFTEMALERAWWLEVREALRTISRRHRSDCAAPLFSELAADRLLAVLRAGRNYDIEWDTISPQLPPAVPDWHEEATPSVSHQVLRQLFDEPTARNIAEHLSWAGEDVAESLVDLEEAMWERTFRIANRTYYGVMEGPSIVVCYYYVRRNELKNLIKTVESAHYGR